MPHMETVDYEAAYNLNNATKVRDQEIQNAVKMEKALLRGKNDHAKRFREGMRQDNSSVSKSDVHSHLAKMNRRAAEKKVANESEDLES